MNDFDPIELRACLGADSSQSLSNRKRGIGRSRRKLEEIETTVSLEDEICERAASVDTDAYELSTGQPLPSTHFHSKHVLHPARAAHDSRPQKSRRLSPLFYRPASLRRWRLKMR